MTDFVNLGLLCYNGFTYVKKKKMKHEDLKKKKEQEGTTQTYRCSGIYSIYGGVYIYMSLI